MPLRKLGIMDVLVAFAIVPIAAGQCPPPSRDPTNQLGTGVDWWVHGFTVQGNDLIAGGYFTTAGAITANGIARWNGSAWQQFGSGMDGPVWSLAVYNGQLFAAGAFNTAGGVPANNIARWDGSAWHALGSGTNLGIITLHVHGGLLIAGGDFTTAGGLAAGRVAAWNGTTWQALGSGPGWTVASLTTFGGQLVAGGSFMAGVAAWNGTTWSSLGPGIAGPIYAVTVYNGELIAGGTYITPPPVQQQLAYIGRLTGGSWQTLGAGIDGYDVLSLLPYNGQLIAGGQFYGSGATPLTNIAAWNGSTFQPLGSGVDDAARVLAVYDGALIVGGLFTSSGALPAHYITKWSSPLPILHVSQPAGAGTGTLVSNSGLVASHEYYNVVGFDLCPGGPGTGPIGGLCFNDLSILVAQLQAPVGTAPFHFIAPATTLAFGPYGVPAGLAFDAVCGDVTGGTLGCVSPVIRYVVQ